MTFDIDSLRFQWDRTSEFFARLKQAGTTGICACHDRQLHQMNVFGILVDKVPSSGGFRTGEVDGYGS